MSDILGRDLNLKGIPDLIRVDRFKGEDNSFPYDGLWCFSGAQGSGKTLQLMHVLREMYKAYPDIIVVSNINIYGIPCIPFKGLEDFSAYDNGSLGIVYVIDEIQTIWNSLESSKMPASSLTVWSQNRKNRRVILCTSQRFNRVAKGIREQTKWLIDCRRPILWFYRYCVTDATLFDENGKYTGEAPQRYKLYVPNVSSMLSYNTLEIVRGDEYNKNG